ncbi:hypothetical protein C8Q74DRAFT_900606 [Fomes fomentarius]|nr:hypothetical protein C8Q74DRAFT_900606 [Fomes fomentarius]
MREAVNPKDSISGSARPSAGASIQYLKPLRFQYPEYQHLTHLALKAVSFVPSNHIPSLTHLAFMEVFMPMVHNQVVAFLSRCPNLEVVLRLCRRRELATGHFRYLETLILQILYHINVPEHELQRLEQYVKTIRVEHYDPVPKMELPEYCTERDVPIRQSWESSAAW